MWVHTCIMNNHVNCCAYVFSCFSFYLVLIMAVSFCLSPILIFNKSYWLYLQLLTLWVFCTVIRLCSLAFFWMGFAYLYMYVYMYFWYKRLLCATLWFSVFREKWIFRYTLTLILFLRSHLEVTCSFCVLSLWYRVK